MQILIIRPFSFDSLKKIINFEPDNGVTKLRVTGYELQVTSDKLRVTINDNSKLRLIYGRF